MFSYLSSVFHYFIPKHSKIDTDDDKQDFLAEELVKLEANEQQNDYDTNMPTVPKTIPRNTECFQRTGKCFLQLCFVK